MHNRPIKLPIVIFLFVVSFRISGILYAEQENKSNLNLNKFHWEVLGDSGWPGNSNGSIEKLNKGTVILNYALKKTLYWPWPEIDFFTDFNPAQDFTKYEGLQLNIKGRHNEEIYFVFLVEDKNLRIPKPVVHRILFSDNNQKIYLPFSRFKIASDWSARHAGLNSSIEWDKVIRVGIHKKGQDGEKGNIYIEDIIFLNKMPKDIFDIEHSRSQRLKYSLIDLKTNSLSKSETEIVIYNMQLPQKDKTIGPYLYGANFGTWLTLPDKSKVIPLNLGIIRFGGPFVDRYNWRNNKYTFMANKRVLSMTSLDDFIQYCRAIGAEPLIQVNALGYAPENKNNGQFIKCINPQDAADLVRYLNKEKKYNIKFFEIGNEPFIWHQVHFDVREKPCSIEEYFDIFKAYSMAMKTAQAEISSASDIKIFAPAFSTSYINWATLAREDKRIAVVPYFLKKCREFENNRLDNPNGLRILDVLSFHLFPSFRDPKIQKISTNTEMILQSTQNWWNEDYINRCDFSLPKNSISKVIPKFKTWIESNYPGTELAVTEFNVESESMVDHDPLTKVLYLSDLYGIFAKYGVNYAQQFCLNSSDQNIALIDDTDNITPLYYPLGLYAKYFKGVVLDTNTSSPEKLNAYACSNEGYVTIMVINKEDRKYASKITIRDNRTGQDILVFSYRFPALSLTCIRAPIDKDENLAESWEYGKDQIS